MKVLNVPIIVITCCVCNVCGYISSKQYDRLWRKLRRRVSDRFVDRLAKFTLRRPKQAIVDLWTYENYNQLTSVVCTASLNYRHRPLVYVFLLFALQIIVFVFLLSLRLMQT